MLRPGRQRSNRCGRLLLKQGLRNQTRSPDLVPWFSRCWSLLPITFLRSTSRDNHVAKTATITTSKGTIVAELFDQEVPNTVQNFEKLANSQFYDGTRFHRVISNFMIQGGDPLSKDPNNPRVGTGGPGYKIKCETHLNTHKHTVGTLSMAHAGKDTGGSQFFICHSPQPHLDRVHTVFGQVTQGMDVVNQIRQNDVITSIRVN
jgi:peptidyl-prolyl cis-trans isomerase B (cyclophilin B)